MPWWGREGRRLKTAGLIEPRVSYMLVKPLYLAI